MKRSSGRETGATGGDTSPDPVHPGAARSSTGDSGTSVLTMPAPAQVATDPALRQVAATPIRILTLIGLGALLVLTTVLGIDVGVASLVVADLREPLRPEACR